MEFILRCEMPVELVVVAELMGSEHRFQFEDREICVKLPEQFHSSIDEASAKRADRFAKCIGWQAKNVTQYLLITYSLLWSF